MDCPALVIACRGIALAVLLAVPSSGLASTLEPVMEVQGNGIQIVDGDQTPNPSDGTSFGTVELGGDAVTQDFSILNQGISDLVLTGFPRVVIFGPAPTDFRVTLQPASPVAASSSTVFSVAFDPTTTGVRSAIVSIDNNDPFRNPFTFTIEGVPEPSRGGLLLGGIYALAGLRRQRS